MKVRVISAVVALAIFIPILLAGGMIFDIAICILAILALKEFMDIKETKKTIPDFMKFVSYLLIVLIVLFNLNSSELVFAIDYKVVSALLLGCLLPVIVYHDRKLYSVNDAFYLIGGIFFLGTSFSLFSLLRSWQSCNGNSLAPSAKLPSSPVPQWLFTVHGGQNQCKPVGVLLHENAMIVYFVCASCLWLHNSISGQNTFGRILN